MRSDTIRDSEYMTCLKDFIFEKYHIRGAALTPAKRGYYGETWKLEADDGSYFIKIDYLPHHQKLFQNSLSVMEYLCDSGIDFISSVVPTCCGELYSVIHPETSRIGISDNGISDNGISDDKARENGILGVFRWIDGENVETDDTKTPEYQLLCQIYPLTCPGFDIPTAKFSNDAAVRFYEAWEKLKADFHNVQSAQNMQTAQYTQCTQSTVGREAERAVLALFEHYSNYFSHCASRLALIAERCQEDTNDFYLTHGDAGGNFFVGNGRNYILDWDEVMYAPLERDAWVMCCRDWARDLFDRTLQANHIPYKLRPERLAFYCYHMFFHYLGEFLADLPEYDMSERIRDYLENGWIQERISFADTI